MIQCPACGATNPDAAAWCGQCLTKFGGPAASVAVAPPPAAEDAAPQPRGPEVGAAAPADVPDDITPSVAPGFRRHNGALEWECVACGEYNELGVDACLRCGTTFAARWAEPPAPPPSPADYRRAVALSAVMAGAGHIALGRRASGLTRALLFTMWLLGGLVLVAAGGPVLLTGGPLLLGAAAVWALALVDLARLRDSTAELFEGRTVVWTVAAVIGLTIVGLLLAAVTSGP